MKTVIIVLVVWIISILIGLMYGMLAVHSPSNYDDDEQIDYLRKWCHEHEKKRKTKRRFHNVGNGSKYAHLDSGISRKQNTGRKEIKKQKS